MMNYLRAAAALIAAFVDSYSAGVRSRATFTARQPQSETSKVFYLSSAETKRARRAARWNQLAAKGSIAAVQRHVPEPVTAPTKVRKPRTRKVAAGVDTASA